MKSLRLWIILGIALAVRLSLLAAAWNHPDQMMTNDSSGYVELAQGLRVNQEFVLSGAPEVFRTPGYPVFLMPWASIDQASHECNLHGLQAVAIIQILLDVLLVFLTYHLGKVLVSHRVGLIAAAFQALSPVVIASSCRILSDSLYALLLTLAIILLVRHFRKDRVDADAMHGPGTSDTHGRDGHATHGRDARATGRFEWWSLVLACVLMVAACYVRPVGLAMMPLVIFVFIFSRMKFRRLALFVGIMALGIAPWIIRNSIVADYKGFSSFATDSMDMYSMPRTVQYLEEHHDSWTACRFGEDRSYPPAENARQGHERVAFLVMRSYPIAFAIVHFKGDAAFWLPGAPDMLEVAGITTGGKGTLDVLQTEGLFAAIKNYFGDNTTALLLALPMVAILLIKYVGVLVSLKLTRLHMQPEVWLMVLIVIVSALLPGPAAHPRFRVPVEPLLNIAAAVGWTIITAWIVRRRKKSPEPQSQERSRTA